MPVKSRRKKQANTQKTLDFIKENYIWILSSIIGISYTAGILNIFLYTHHINRPDLFNNSLQFGPELTILAATYISILLLFILTTTIPSVFFLLFFFWLKPNSAQKNTLAFTLIKPIIIGISILIILLLFEIPFLRNHTLASWIVIIVTISIYSTYKIIKNYSTSLNALDATQPTLKKPLEVSIVFSLILFVTITSFYPIWLTLAVYQPSPTLSERAELIAVAIYFFSISASSLAPAIFYITNSEKNLLNRIKSIALSISVIIYILLYLLPSTFSFISEASMRALGILDTSNRTYLISQDKYPKNMLDNKLWNTKQINNNYYSIEVFSLYSYGSINLLCPIKHQANNNKKEISQDCIPFNKHFIQLITKKHPQIKN